KLSQLLEECPQLVVAALDGDGDRYLGQHVPILGILGLEQGDSQPRLRGQIRDLSIETRDLTLRGQALLRRLQALAERFCLGTERTEVGLVRTRLVDLDARQLV